MRQELWWWAASYHQAARADGEAQAAERLAARGYVLEDALHRLDYVRAALEGLPRLS